MSCDEVKELFSEHYDNAEISIISMHLQTCPACAKEYESFAYIMDEVQALPAPAVPAGFHDTLMKRVRKISFFPRRSLYISAAGAAAASLLVLWLWVANYTDDNAYQPLVITEQAAPFAEATDISWTEPRGRAFDEPLIEINPMWMEAEVIYEEYEPPQTLLQQIPLSAIPVLGLLVSIHLMMRKRKR